MRNFGRFLTTKSVSLIDVGLLSFSMSSVSQCRELSRHRPSRLPCLGRHCSGSCCRPNVGAPRPLTESSGYIRLLFFFVIQARGLLILLIFSKNLFWIYSFSLLSSCTQSSYSSKYFLISSQWLLCPMDYQRVSSHFQVVTDSLNIFLFVTFTSIILWSENVFCMISGLSNLSQSVTTPGGLLRGHFSYPWQRHTPRLLLLVQSGLRVSQVQLVRFCSSRCRSWWIVSLLVLPLPTKECFCLHLCSLTPLAFFRPIRL